MSLAANRAAVTDLVAAAERSAATWTTPRAGEMVAEPGSGACGAYLGRIGEHRFWGSVEVQAR